jgi:hypothetical protein
MKRFVISAFVLVVSNIVGVSRVEALSPPAVEAVFGRCIFPSPRTLAAIISTEAKKTYLSQGYKQAFVGVRVFVQRPILQQLKKGNVRGLKGISPTAGNPAMLRITANSKGAPLELGCNVDAEITTTVVLIDAKGVRSNGRSVTKVIVQGAFQ